MIELLGFTPDLEPTTPGAVMECGNFVPFSAGMKAAPSPADAGLDALADVSQGAAVTRNLAGTSRLFAGTSTDIYELTGTAWGSVSTGHSLPVDSVWRFAAFGDAALAVCPTVGLLRSTGAAFSTVSGAPKAKTIIAAKGFIMALATNETTYGDSPDRWWCSASFDETDWTPDVATQCATGRLVEGSGGLTAGLRMGDGIVAYKERAIFVGQYIGGGAVWQWSPPIGDVGCVGVEAVADTPAGHIFVGSDNIYLFDGTRPVAIGDQIRQWWIDNSSAEFRFRSKLLWDRDNGLVWFFFPSSGSSTGDCDSTLVFHVQTKRWGVANIAVQTVLNYTSSGITYDTGSPLIPTYDTGAAFSYDSPFWLASKSNPAVFGTDNTVYSLTGIPGDSYFVTGDYGGEGAYSTCSALRARFSRLPTSSTCQGYTKEMSGGTASNGSQAAFDGAKYPMRQCGRFHRFRVDMVGDGRVTGIEPALSEAGRR